MLQYWVPDENIAIETISAIGTFGDPIIIIGSTSVVTKSSILLHTSNTHEEDGFVLFAEDVLTLLGGGMGVFLHHRIRVGEDQFLRKDRFDSVFLANGLFSIVDSFVDGLYGGPENKGRCRTIMNNL